MTIQAPGEPLLDNESTRGDERVSARGVRGRSGVSGLTLAKRRPTRGEGGWKAGPALERRVCLSQGQTLFQWN